MIFLFCDLRDSWWSGFSNALSQNVQEISAFLEFARIRWFQVLGGIEALRFVFPLMDNMSIR